MSKLRCLAVNILFIFTMATTSNNNDICSELDCVLWGCCYWRMFVFIIIINWFHSFEQTSSHGNVDGDCEGIFFFVIDNNSIMCDISNADGKRTNLCHYVRMTRVLKFIHLENCAIEHPSYTLLIIAVI